MWGTWQTYTLHSLPELYFEDGSECAPYHDHAFHRWSRTYSNTGASGSQMSISWNSGFEAISRLDDITRYNCTCTDCDEHYHEDDMTWIGDNQVCSGCRDENYRYCEECDEYHQ